MSEPKTIKIKDIKSNPNNPRLIKDDKFKKLVKSIKEFPGMLKIRPVVVDEDYMILGGNMRTKACLEAGMAYIPYFRYTIEMYEKSEESKSMSYQEACEQFIIKDNVGFGEWDWDILANEWDVEKLEDWSLSIPIPKSDIPHLDLKDVEFEEEFEKYNDGNCENPIVPAFHEKHSYFIILCENEIDEKFIRNTFELNEKHTSHKSTDDRLSNVISVEKLQKAWLKSK